MPVMLVQVVDALEPAPAAASAGRYAESRVALERYVAGHPREARAWAALAQTYAALKLPKEAAEAASKAEQSIDRSPEAQHALALYYAQNGNRARAAELECLYASSTKADAAAPARAAMLSSEVGHWKQAIEFGEKAVKAGHRLDLLLPMLAVAYEHVGREKDAAEIRSRIAQAAPENEDAQSAYGIALLRAGRFADAVRQLEEARRKFPASAQVELALGTGYYAQRRFADAAERFFRVIELAPSIHQPYIFLARMIDQIPDRAPAFVEVAKAWNASSKHPFAPFVYAKALLAVNPPAPVETIRPLLEEAIRRDAAAWEFHFELGQLEERRRDFAAAAKSYEKSIACEASRPEPHYRLARMYDRLGRSEDARRERELHERLLRTESTSIEPQSP